MLRWLRDLTRRATTPTLEAAGRGRAARARAARSCARRTPSGASATGRSVPPISLVGVGPGHGAGDLARAVLESAAHAVACNFARLDCARRRTPRPTSSSPAAAGARAFAAQLLADVLGRRVVVPELGRARGAGWRAARRGPRSAAVQPPLRVLRARRRAPRRLRAAHAALRRGLRAACAAPAAGSRRREAAARHRRPDGRRARRPRRRARLRARRPPRRARPRVALGDGAAAGAVGWVLEAERCGDEELSALPGAAPRRVRARRARERRRRRCDAARDPRALHPGPQRRVRRRLRDRPDHRARPAHRRTRTICCAAAR